MTRRSLSPLQLEHLRADIARREAIPREIAELEAAIERLKRERLYLTDKRLCYRYGLVNSGLRSIIAGTRYRTREQLYGPYQAPSHARLPGPSLTRVSPGTGQSAPIHPQHEDLTP